MDDSNSDSTALAPTRPPAPLAAIMSRKRKHAGRPRYRDPATQAWRMAYAQRFREAREAAALSQREVARIMKVVQPTVNLIEKNGLVPTAEALARASQRLGVDFERMIPDRASLRGRKSGIESEQIPADPDSIEGRIIKRRKDCGLTQELLGMSLDPPASQSQVSLVEAGVTKMEYEGVVKYARALNVDPSYIDVRLVPERVIRLTREAVPGRDDWRWVADTEADWDGLRDLVGERYADFGIPENRVEDLVAQATERRIGLVFHGEREVRHDITEGREDRMGDG